MARSAAARTSPSSSRQRSPPGPVVSPLNAYPPPPITPPRVGLVINPHAGRDVRRLVAPASSLTNHERVNLVRRLLVGLQAGGIGDVLYMPDRYGVVERAIAAVPGMVGTAALADPAWTPDDTPRATEAMVAAGAAVLITHGGDGTNRLVALRAGSAPILPIAAGTNNVFPMNVEPTAAGLAAAVLSRFPRQEATRAGCVERHKRIRVTVDGGHDVALVDAAITRDTAIGGRAVWDPGRVVAFMVTRAAAGTVGLSSLAGALLTIEPTQPSGAFAEMGPGTTVLALVAPGLVVPAEIRSVREVAVGSEVPVGPVTGTVTLDGERALHVQDGVVRLALDADGPWVVNLPATLRWAQRLGALRLA